MMKMRAQQGATLVIALIMLVLLTLFAVSALNTGTTNLKVVGNMQTRNEAFNAAQQVIEATISTSQFIAPDFATGTNPVPNSCDGAPDKLCTDAAGNFVANAANALYTIQLNPKPACVAGRAIKLGESEIDYGRADNRSCWAAPPQLLGVAGAVTGDSLCANMVWEITAETTAVVSGAKAAVVVQGVGSRILTDDVAALCP